MSRDEFQVCFADERIRTKLKRLGVEVDELDVLFDLIDADGSGDVTAAELLDGFMKLRNPVAASNRLIDAMHQEFLLASRAMEIVRGTFTDKTFNLFIQREPIMKQLKLLKKLHPLEKLFAHIAEGSTHLTWEDVETGMRKVLRSRAPVEDGRKSLAQAARKTQDMISRFSVVSKDHPSKPRARGPSQAQPGKATLKLRPSAVANLEALNRGSKPLGSRLPVLPEQERSPARSPRKTVILA